MLFDAPLIPDMPFDPGFVGVLCGDRIRLIISVDTVKAALLFVACVAVSNTDQPVFSVRPQTPHLTVDQLLLLV